jgi:hypothetical protein
LISAFWIAVALPSIGYTQAMADVRQNESELTLSATTHALSVAPIKTLADLLRYIDAPVESESPLSALNNRAFSAFVSSLTFNEKGLTGYSYLPLRGLSASRAHEILALFEEQRYTSIVPELDIQNSLDAKITRGSYFVSGQQYSFRRAATSELKWWFTNNGDDDILHGDHENYSCVARATCEKNVGYICKSNC